MFTFDGSVWRGQHACPGKCVGYRGDRVVSEIHCFGDKLHTCDQGYDLKTGEMVWGSERCTVSLEYNPSCLIGSAVEHLVYTEAVGGSIPSSSISALLL